MITRNHKLSHIPATRGDEQPKNIAQCRQENMKMRKEDLYGIPCLIQTAAYDITSSKSNEINFKISYFALHKYVV
jgi:hypothetical protein